MAQTHAGQSLATLKYGRQLHGSFFLPSCSSSAKNVRKMQTRATNLRDVVDKRFATVSQLRCSAAQLQMLLLLLLLMLLQAVANLPTFAAAIAAPPTPQSHVVNLDTYPSKAMSGSQHGCNKGQSCGLARGSTTERGARSSLALVLAPG